MERAKMDNPHNLPAAQVAAIENLPADELRALAHQLCAGGAPQSDADCRGALAQYLADGGALADLY